MRLLISTPVGQGFSMDLHCEPKEALWRIKERVCRIQGFDFSEVCFISDGFVVDERESVGVRSELALIPKEIKAAVDEQALIAEFQYLRTQFPLVKMVDLLTYKGKIRCDRGYVKELAEKGVWPFVEYVKWHEFKMVLSFLHPFKPPTVTWLTEINHPNIIPRKKGKVCVSILGKKWLPNTKLAAVINALYFLLSDPNPYSAYPTKRCKKVAKICRMYGFPLKRGGGVILQPPSRR